MSADTRRRHGVLVDRSTPPEDVRSFVGLVDAAGADDVWFVEDLGWSGGLTSAAVGLSTSSRLRVGVGVCPVALRNPALLAMEFAFLARAFPGRFVGGVGHGVQAWMAQAGEKVSSPVTLLEESLQAVRTLLRGATVSVAGRYVQLDDISLVHPPSVVPPVLAGVTGPRSLRLAGSVADGVVLVEGLSPAATASSVAAFSDGRDSSRDSPGEVVSLVWGAVSDDADVVAGWDAPIRAEAAGFLGVPPDDVCLAVGTYDDVVATLRSLYAAGTGTILIRLAGGDPAEQLPVLMRACREAAGVAHV